MPQTQSSFNVKKPQAYIEASKDPAKRLYCDFCNACLIYNCDGSTARHHMIHIEIFDDFGPRRAGFKDG